MKILMIAPQPFFSPRGTPFSVLYRLHALSKLGHTIDLVTYHLGEDVSIENVTIYRIPDIPFVRHIEVGPSKLKIFLDCFVLLKVLQLLLKNRYDVIHSHEEAGFFSRWLATLFHTRHLYDMHSSLPQQLHNFKFTRSGLLVKMFEKLENDTLKNADAVITICPALSEYVQGVFPGKNEVMIENVMDNSSVLDAGTETVSDIIKKYGIKGRPKILYAGTFEAYQGIDLLIDAAAQVVRKYPDAVFIMVGGHPDQVEAYVRKVENLGLEKNFVFSGQVWPNLVPLFVELSDMLVSPRIEGNNTPLKIYSYLRSGKPIVATDHPTHTQVLDSSVAVLTDPHPDEFAEGIMKVIENDALAKEIVSEAVSLAEARYSIDAYLAKIRKIYRSLEG